MRRLRQLRRINMKPAAVAAQYCAALRQRMGSRNRQRSVSTQNINMVCAARNSTQINLSLDTTTLKTGSFPDLSGIRSMHTCMHRSTDIRAADPSLDKMRIFETLAAAATLLLAIGAMAPASAAPKVGLRSFTVQTARSNRLTVISTDARCRHRIAARDAPRSPSGNATLLPFLEPSLWHYGSQAELLQMLSIDIQLSSSKQPVLPLIAVFGEAYCGGFPIQLLQWLALNLQPPLSLLSNPA